MLLILKYGSTEGASQSNVKSQLLTPKLGLARQAPEIIDKAYALLTVYWIPRQAELRIFGPAKRSSEERR